MTPEQAIERVESLAESDEPWDPGVPTIHDRTALRLVIEAAKRPTALSGEERKELEDLAEDANYELQEVRHYADPHKHADVIKSLERRWAALTAALSLASPFTREELEILRDAAAWYPSEAEGCRSHESALERYYPVAAKLDAVLEDK